MAELGEEIKGFKGVHQRGGGRVSSHHTTAMAFIFNLFQHTFLFAPPLKSQLPWKDSLMSYFSFSSV